MLNLRTRRLERMIMKIPPGIKKDGKRWLVRVNRRCPKTGRKLNRKGQAPTLEEAKKLKAELEREIDKGVSQARVVERVTLATYANSWLIGKRGRIRMSTAELYATIIEASIKPALGDYYLDMIDESDIEGWIQSLSEVQPVTANGYLKVLRRILNHAVKDRTLDRNPANNVPLLTEEAKPKARTAEEVEALLGVARTAPYVRVWYPHILTLADAGLRFGELAALRTDDIRGDMLRIERAAWRGKLGPTKTGRVREVPITQRLEKVLKAHRANLLRRQNPGLAEGWLFPNRTGELMRYPAQLNRPLAEASRLAELPQHVTCHQLRHTLNNRLREALGDYAVVQSILGHCSDSMTVHYSHVSPAEKRSALLRLAAS